VERPLLAHVGIAHGGALAAEKLGQFGSVEIQARTHTAKIRHEPSPGAHHGHCRRVAAWVEFLVPAAGGAMWASISSTLVAKAVASSL